VYLDRLRELFSGVDWAPFEEVVNSLYTLEGRGRRPKPPIAYFRAVLVKTLLEISSFFKLVERLGNNPDLASLCCFMDPSSKRVKAYVGIALTPMLLIAAASYRNGKPWLTKSIEYYASH